MSFVILKIRIGIMQINEMNMQLYRSNCSLPFIRLDPLRGHVDNYKCDG